MRVLIHETLTTLYFAQPARDAPGAAGFDVEFRDSLGARGLQAGDAALIPAAEIAHLTASHVVVPEVAVVFDGSGPIAMRVPVRPDEIELTPVSLNGVSGTAEILARATLEPFYGIRTSDYAIGTAADAKVVLLEGVETLLPVEAGFQENLVRAWFVLTGQPVVSHLLVVPKSWPAAEIDKLAKTMTAMREQGHARRSELRAAAAESAGVQRDALPPVFATMRYALDAADRRALLMLLQHGNKGSTYPYVWTVDYVEAAPADE